MTFLSSSDLGKSHKQPKDGRPREETNQQIHFHLNKKLIDKVTF